MEHQDDTPLPLEFEFQLKRVADQAQKLDAHQLRHALLCAWSGWLTERHTLQETVKEKVGIQLQVGAVGFLPFECCGVEP